MNVSSLVSELTEMGVELSVSADQLRYKAPAGALTSEHKRRMKERKQEIIAYLESLSKRLETRRTVDRHEPFPLTDLQLAYVVGRTNAYPLGGVGCHSYIELDLPSTDTARLERAWHCLIARHDMLRCVILPDGRQRVQPQVTPPPIVALDLRGLPEGEAERCLLTVRDQMSHRRYDPERWPMFDVRLTHLDGGAVLHFSIDLLIADFASIQVLLAELGEVYHHPERALPELAGTFREVVLARHAAQHAASPDPRRAQDRDYWLGRLASLPGPPELPTLPMSVPVPVRFGRQHLELSPERWRSLSRRAGAHRLTPSSVVLAAFTEVLGRWSRNPDFCINSTLLNRAAEDSDLAGIVGDFIAVNVLAVQRGVGATFAESAARLQDRLWEDMEHSAFSGMDVLRAASQRLGAPFLIPVVYTSTLGVDGERLADNEFMRRASLRFGITQTPQVWLDCQTTERGGALHLDWDVRLGIFPDGLIEDAFGVLGRLLEALADGDERWVATTPVELPPATVETRRRVNETSGPLPSEALHGGFCRRALEQPQALAVSAADGAVTYAQLARWALDVADRLRRAGAAAGDRVAIALDKSARQIAAVLGALFADGTYVPLDAAQPRARRDAMLADATVRWVLTDAAREREPWPEGVGVLNVPALEDLDAAREDPAWRSRLTTTIAEIVRSDRIGYIIFTSGSTGRPKGVLMGHVAALNTVRDINQRFALGAGDRVLGLANISFDLSVWDVFGTLGAGAALVLPDPARRSDPSHWAALMEDEGVTLWNSVPAQMQMLVDWLDWQPERRLASLRIAMLSGDWIPVPLPDRVRARLPGVQVVSLGGPTETAIWCVWHAIGVVPPGAPSIPYGVPLTNHRIHVLDQRLELCPDFVTGELYIGGSGLAAGYAGDAAKTAERFIVHPVTGERLYRSGDLGRCDRQGIIEFMGRDDHQIKLRGHRIELGEIEAACARLPEIRRAVAFARGTPATLAVVLVPADAAAPADTLIERCRQSVRASLPEYMVPADLAVVDALPLSPNGKVDRKRLLELLNERVTGEAASDEPPVGPHEVALAGAWAEVLGSPIRSRRADFFQVGGSSVTAVQLLGVLLGRGYPATLELLFARPVLAEMAAGLVHAHLEQSSWLDDVDLGTMARDALTGLDGASPPVAAGAVRTLLLTGATGFLGGYLLQALLVHTDWTVCCLVRGADEAEGRVRLERALADKGLSVDLSRVTVCCGDLALDGLGLAPERYAELATQVDVVIHNASLINLMDPLARLYPINVQGAARVLRFATTTRLKPVHYVSTIAVHHALPEPSSDDDGVPEATRIERWAGSRLTYEQSKIMAETLFYHARERGLPVNILRPATISWATSGVPFINDDAFLKFYRACLGVGAYPASPLKVNLVPVDVVARGVALVAREATVESNNYHLVARRSVPVEQIYRWLDSLGCRFEALPFADWMARIEDPFVAGFVNLYFEDGMRRGGHRQYHSDNLDGLVARAGGHPFELNREYFAPLAARFPAASLAVGAREPALTEPA